MIYKIVAIRDRAADTFSTPMFVPSVGIGIRSFSDEVNRAADNNMLYKHPDDYDLYLLGEYNDDQATFDATRPEQIAIGRDVKLV